MSQYRQCCVCGLNLPVSIMQPIPVKHQGKVVMVAICNRCKDKKELEAKEKR